MQGGRRLVNDLLTLARREEMQSSDPEACAQDWPVVDLDSLLLEVFRQYRTSQPAHSAAACSCSILCLCELPFARIK